MGVRFPSLEDTRPLVIVQRPSSLTLSPTCKELRCAGRSPSAAPRQPGGVRWERRAHGCRQGAPANPPSPRPLRSPSPAPRPNPPKGSGRGARPSGGGRSLPGRLRPAEPHKISAASEPLCVPVEVPQVAWSSALLRCAVSEGRGHFGPQRRAPGRRPPFRTTPDRH